MARSILSNASPEVHPENRSCETCLHWLADHNHPVFAKIAGASVRVAQCGNEESDLAPMSSTDSSDAFVFTPANGSCQGFELHPEATAEASGDYEHYRSLDQQLSRAAWM